MRGGFKSKQTQNTGGSPRTDGGRRYGLGTWDRGTAGKKGGGRPFEESGDLGAAIHCFSGKVRLY